MKIVQIVSGMDKRGPALRSIELAERLLARGCSMLVVCQKGSWLAENIEASECLQVVESNLRIFGWTRRSIRQPIMIPLAVAGARRLPAFFPEIVRLADAMRSFGVQIIHTHSTRANLIGLILGRLLAVPVVTTAHAHRKYYHWRMADCVIAPSKASAQYHQRVNGVSAEKCRIIYHGIEAERYRVDKNTRHTIRSALNIADDEIAIGLLGVIIPAKGQDVALKAVASIVDKAPNIVLCIFGSSELEPGFLKKLKTYAKSNNIEKMVRIYQPTDDVPGILSAMDIYICPSVKGEVMPFVVQEGMAAGLPVIASRIGGIPEMIEDGVSGLLVSPGSVNELADAMLRLIREPETRNAIGEQARARMVSDFTMDNYINNIISTYEWLITHSGVRENIN